MHGPINFKSPNNTSKWQMGFYSAFKGLILHSFHKLEDHQFLAEFSCTSTKIPKSIVGTSEGKGKAIPLQAWTGPEGSRKLRLPDFKTIDT
jgi:hypothetical protein